MPKPAVIFDMDGVLADTYQPHFASWQRLYNSLGIKYEESDFAADFGRTSVDILGRTLGNDLTAERIRELDRHKEAYFRDIARESSVVADGAVELIDSLISDGFLIAVGSSGPPENIELLLHQLARAECFGAVVTGADVTRGKPDPQVFQLAAEQLRVPPAMCVVIEDAVHGIEAAHRAGMKSVGVVGTSTRADLSKANVVVESLRELTPPRLRGLISGVTE
jgi:beta-phosphoglucomutase